MKIFKKISGTIDTANDWLGHIFSLMSLITLAVILCEVVLRRLFNKPQIWTNDMICMSFGCYVILISAYGFLKKSFVCVDVFFAMLPKVGQHILHIVTYFIFFVPFVFKLLPTSWNFWMKAYTIHELSYSVWQPPTWPLKFCLFLGLFLLAVQGISEILKNLDWVIDYYRNGCKEPEEKTVDLLTEIMGDDAEEARREMQKAVEATEEKNAADEQEGK